MRSFAILAVVAAVSAQHFDPSKAGSMADGMIPGTDKISPKCSSMSEVAANDCPAAPENGNIMVHAWHQIIDEQSPNVDKNASFNGVSVGINNADLSEVRTLAIFPNFPESGKGKQCRMHFITNGGANVASSYVTRIGVWSLKPGKDSNLETTWRSKPDRNQKVAAFDQTAPSIKMKPAKDSHKGVEGPAFPREETFPCPAPGSHVAWELAMDTPKSTWNNTMPQRLFAGGMNGFALEIMGVKQTGYGTSLPSSTIATPSPLKTSIKNVPTPATTNGADVCNGSDKKPHTPKVSTPVVHSGPGWHVGGRPNATVVSAMPSPTNIMGTGSGSSVKPALGFMGAAAMVAYAFF